MNKQQEIDLQKRVMAAAETLLTNALMGVDGLVCVIDAMATIHATLLVKQYENDDWSRLLQDYCGHVAEKIIAIGEARVKLLEVPDERPH
jgi:ABC-type Fe2+-enterobactin transport system substrate-binding protein